MDDLVLREVTILIKNCRGMARTLIELRQALLADKRFASVGFNTESVSEEKQTDWVEGQGKEGPEAQSSSDPFSVPLRSSRD